jgi:hypothetical protein
MDARAADCYIVTGTGRCGTMLVQRLLALSGATTCVHEQSVRYAKLADAYLAETPATLYGELDAPFGRCVTEAHGLGRSFGEASALMFLCVPELARRYGARVRFVLLARRAEDFVRSAIARGFFEPAHAHPLEHVRPGPETDLGRRWDEASPVEKCLWYWQLVNGTVLTAFDRLPAPQCAVQTIETFDIDACERLYAFLGLPDFESVRDQAAALLGRRINGTPGLGDEADANPWSVAAALDALDTWSASDREAYRTWAAPLMQRLYGSAGKVTSASRRLRALPCSGSASSARAK